MHRYKASFSIKTCFYEANKVFISRTTQNYTKLSTASESPLKINITLRCTLFENLLMSAITCSKQRFLHKKRFYNTFETTNAIAFNKM